MKMIRTVCLLLSCSLIMGWMAGCNNGPENQNSQLSSNILSSVESEGSNMGDNSLNQSSVGNTGSSDNVSTPADNTGGSKSSTKSSGGSSSSTSKPTDSKNYGDVKAKLYSPSVTPNMAGVLTVDADTIINKSIIGGGVNFDYSSYVFMGLDNGGEWSGTRSQHIPYFPDEGEYYETLWDEYFKMIDFSGMQYIRLNISFLMWEPINDNNDPFNTDFDKGFTFSPNFTKRADAKSVPKNTLIYMQKFYKLLDYFEKKGLYVILGNWDIGSQSTGFCPDGKNWMAKKNADGTYMGRDGGKINVNSLDEYAETFAAIMYHLKVQKKYTCVKGFSFWNEPENLHDFENVMVAVYNKFGQHLTRLGIRDKVLIQAYDSPVFWNVDAGNVPDQITRMLPKCGNNMDIISIHHYLSNIEAGPVMNGTRGPISKTLIEDCAARAVAQAKGRPVVIGELGTFAFNTNAEMSPKDFRLKIHGAEATAQLFNAGVKATGFWIYNCYLHQHFTMLDFDKNNSFRMIPDDTNYYPTALTMKYLPGGTNIVKSTLTGCTDSAAQRVFATVGKKGKDTTILLVNDSDNPAKLTIKGIDTSKKYNYHYVAKGQTDRIYPGGTVDFSRGSTIAIRPQSIVVLTTYTYGTQTVRI